MIKQLIILLGLILVPNISHADVDLRVKICDELGRSTDTFKNYSAKDKLTVLWSRVKASAYTDKELTDKQKWGEEFKKKLGAFQQLLNDKDPSHIMKSFEHQCDEMPAGRQKPIHPFGSVAKVTLRVHHDVKDPDGELYTGLFEKGQEISGLARLSLASPSSFAPGMALKLLIPGQESVNVIVMFSLDGQESRNFFLNSFSQTLKPSTSTNPILIQLSKAFRATVKKLNEKHQQTGSDHFFKSIVLPLHDMAAVKSDGTKIEDKNVRAPRIMVFIPTRDSTSYNLGLEKGMDFRREFRHSKILNRRVVLYRVYVKHDEGKKHHLQPLGDLVLESPLVASDYGDNTLFFRHSWKVVVDKR